MATIKAEKIRNVAREHDNYDQGNVRDFPLN